MAKVLSSMLEKIQKLMIMAEGAATQGEMENAARMVQELLLKHNLSLADIDAHVNVNEENTISDEHIDYSDIWKKIEGNWIRGLYICIAQYNLCSVVSNPDRLHGKIRSSKLWVIGKSDNVNVVIYLTQQLIPRIRMAEQNAWDIYPGYEKRGMFRRGFLQGCIEGIRYQLFLQEQALRQEEQKIDAMIIVNKAALEEYQENRWASLKNNRKSSLSSTTGRTLGRREGKNMKLQHGITEGRTGSSSNKLTGLLN